MSSRLRSRRLFLRVCWLALVCTMAMAAATPDIAVDGSRASGVAVGAIGGDSGATLPATGPAAGSEIDNLAATEAARPFRLGLFFRHGTHVGHEPTRVYSHSLAIAGERGPPAQA